MKAIVKSLLVVLSFSLLFSLTFAKKQDQDIIKKTRADKAQVMSKMEHQRDVAKKSTEPQDMGEQEGLHAREADQGSDQQNIEPLSDKIRSGAKKEVSAFAPTKVKVRVIKVESASPKQGTSFEKDEYEGAQSAVVKTNTNIAISEDNTDATLFKVEETPEPNARNQRADLNLTFEDDSDVANWSNYDESTSYTTVTWDQTGGVGGTGALHFSDAGWGFLIKRPVSVPLGSDYGITIDIKVDAWTHATNTLDLSIQGLSTTDPSVQVSGNTTFTTVTLTGTADLSSTGYIRLYGMNDGNPSSAYIDNLVFDDSTVTSGGPDTYGYTWTNSYDAAGPTYSWIDTTGAVNSLLQGDDYRGQITLPFPFYFYGTWYNTAWLSTNGWLSFGDDPGSSYYSNSGIPSTSGVENMVAAFWDDLKTGPTYHGDIYTKTVGTEPNRQFVAIWQDVYRTGQATDNWITFEVILDEATQDITIQYQDVIFGNTSYDNGMSATVGIENLAGDDGIEYEYNGSPRLVYDELAIEFVSPALPTVPGFTALDTEIDFGNTGTAGVVTNAQVQNSGGIDLNITAISFTNTDFSSSVSSLTLTPGETGTIDVGYYPTALEPDTGYMIITHNGSTSPDSIKLMGVGVDAIFWQDFEAWATNSYYSDPDPVGWSQEAAPGTGSSDGKMWEKEYNTSSGVFSGLVAAEFDSYEGADGDTGSFITPEIDFTTGSATDITTASFKFYYKKRGTKTFRVDYSSDQGANWTTGFTTTAENYQSGSAGWDQVSINIPVGSTYIFKFIGEASGSSTTGDVFIDEVSMTEVPPTPALDLTYSSLTFFPAEIGDIVTDSTFAVGVNSGAGDLIVDSIVTTNANFSVALAAAITSGDTIYGGGSVDVDITWTPTTFGWDVTDVIFYTNAATSPDTMQMKGEASRQYVNFDDETFPPGWNIIDNDTVNAYGYDDGWIFYSSYGPGYSVPYVRSHFNVDGANDWMITQKLSVVAGDSIIFYSNSSSSSILEDTLHVYVSTTDNDMSSFATQIGEVLSQGYTNLRTAIDLSTWAGTEIYLAIVHHGSVGTNYWSYRKVDDVMLPARWIDPNPVAALSASAIDFGITYQNLSLDDFLTITNTGGSDLVISGIATDNTDFTVDVSSATVAPDSALEVTVTFTPSTTDTIGGNLIITSNAATSPDTVTLTGVGDATSGGPDGFDYTWVNSYDAAGPVFSWIDTAGATNTGIANGDDWRGTVNLPFEFRFYGVPYNQITVTTNGWIGMGPYTNYSSSYWTNYPIPTSSSPNNIIAGLWDDWKAGGTYPAGDILVKTVGTAPNRQFVVFFFEFVRSSSNTDFYTWEVVLDEATSDITVQYLDVVGSSDYANNGVGATVGIENADGSDGLEVEYNGSHPIYDGMALFFDAPPPPPTGVEGNVVSVTSGLPLEGVAVNIGGFLDSTDANGDYALYGIEPGLYDAEFEKDGFNPAYFTISLSAGDTIILNAALMEDSTTIVSSYVTGFEAGQDQGSTVLLSGSNTFAVVDSFVASSGTILPSAGSKMLAFPDSSGTYDNNDLAYWVSDSVFDVIGYGSLTLTMDANWDTEDGWDYFYIGLVLDDGSMYYMSADGLTGTSSGWETVTLDVSWALAMGTTTVQPAILFDADGSVVSGWGGAFDEVNLSGNTFYLAPPMDLMAESYQPTVNLSWTAPASNGRVNYTLKQVNPNAGNISRPLALDDSGNLVERQKGSRDYPTVEVSYRYSASNRTLTGYNVFRAQWPFGDVELLTFTTGTSYEDASAVNGNYYEYAVTAVYDEGESGESNIANVRVGAVTVFTDDISNEDFEGVAPSLPANWEVFSSSSDHVWVVGDSAAADSAFGAYGNGAPDAHTDFGFINPGYGSDDFEMYLLSPFIDFMDNYTAIVKFAGYAQVWGNFAGNNFVQLWVRADMGPWEAVVDFGYDHNNGWIDYSAPIGNVVSGQDKVQFAFYYTHTGGLNSGGGNGMAIDDFTLETLDGPHDLVLTPTTESIILNWMHPDSTLLNGLSDPVTPIVSREAAAPVPAEDVIVTERTDCFSHGSVNSSWITGFYGPDSGGVIPPTFAALHTFNAGPMTLDEAVIHGYYNTDDTTTARADVFVGVADLTGTTIDTLKRDTVFFDISAAGSWTQASLDLTGLVYNATDSTFLKVTWTPLDTGYVALFDAQLWIPGQQIDNPNTVPANGFSGYDSAGVFTPSGTYNFVIEICGTPTPPSLSFNIYKDGNRVVEGLEETTWTDGNVSVVDESCYWVHGVVPMSFNIGPATIDSMMETDPTNVECATAINLPPNSFDLVSPADGDTIFITPANQTGMMLFAWTSSSDPNGQDVTFNWTVESSELGTITLDTSGTAIFIPYEDLIALLSAASANITTATWEVIATDGMDDTPSSNGPRTFTIDITQLGIDAGPAIPEVFALHQNYPNPFNPITTIRYDIPEESLVRVDIYNILGQKVRTLVNSVHQPGFHAIQWNGTNDFGVPVASGMYIYRIQAKDFVSVKKLVLMK